MLYSVACRYKPAFRKQALLILSEVQVAVLLCGERSGQKVEDVSCRARHRPSVHADANVLPRRTARLRPILSQPIANDRFGHNADEMIQTDPLAHINTMSIPPALHSNVHPADMNRALTAIKQARATLNALGQRYLVTRPNGVPAKNLKEALGIRRNLCYRAGIRSHGARYAFTRERLRAYRNADYKEREARAATSVDLGHGDGRGRYVSSVYARGCS